MTSSLSATPEEGKGRGRCQPLTPGNQGQDMWEHHKAVPQEVPDRWKEIFLYFEGGTLEQLPWRAVCLSMFKSHQVTSITCFNFCLVLKSPSLEILKT